MGEVSESLASDLDEVRTLVEEIGNFTSEERTNLMDSIDYYTRNPEYGEFKTLIYRADLRLCGLLSYGRGLGEGTFEIYWIAVAQDMQGKSIGANLLLHAEAEIALMNGRIIFIETESGDRYERARRLYMKNGYRLAASIPDYFAEGNDKQVYSKKKKGFNVKKKKDWMGGGD